MPKSTADRPGGGLPEFTQTWAMFRPTTLEKITGLTAAHQRVWRRRGHLPQVDGARAEFDTLEAAAISIRYQLGLRGLPPMESLALGEEYAAVAVYHAIANASGAVEVFGPTEEAVDRFKAEYDRDLEIATKVAGVAKVDPGSFLLGFDDAPAKLVADLDLPPDDGRQYSGFFLNLESIGRRLSDNARVPLVSIRLKNAEDAGPLRVVRNLLVRARPRPPAKSKSRTQ